MPEPETFFGLSRMHVAFAAVGAAIFIANLVPHVLFRRSASSAGILMILGLASFAFLPGMPRTLDPTASPRMPPTSGDIDPVHSQEFQSVLADAALSQAQRGVAGHEGIHFGGCDVHGRGPWVGSMTSF